MCGGCSPEVFGVSKLLFSGLCWEHTKRRSKVPSEGCAGPLQDLPRWRWAPWLSHNPSQLQSSTSRDPPTLCSFSQPWSPCPTPTSWAPQPCRLLHPPPSTASAPQNISRIRPSSQTLPNCKFWMVSTRNQESDQICLKMGPVSFKPCYKLQQTDFGFWLSCETWNHMCSTWFRFLLWISYTALWE